MLENAVAVIQANNWCFGYPVICNHVIAKNCIVIDPFAKHEKCFAKMETVFSTVGEQSQSRSLKEFFSMVTMEEDYFKLGNDFWLTLARRVKKDIYLIVEMNGEEILSYVRFESSGRGAHSFQKNQKGSFVGKEIGKDDGN